MNLIEQQNLLKGLTDEALQAQLSQPGSTPPYLVATEIGRRQDMRQRYEGEQARRGKQSTVIEDLMAMNGGLSQAPMAQPQMPAAPAPAEGGIAAFAEGGLVGSGGGLDYAALSERYNDALTARPEREKRARALALLAAGAGMMGGGSSNTLTNIGKGVSAGTESYALALSNIDTEERQALRDAVDLGRITQADELQRLEFGYRQSSDAADRALRERELERGDQPASVREAMWYETATPEERAAYDKINAPSNRPTDLPKVIDDVYQSALRSIPEVTVTMMDEPAAVQEKQNERYRLAEVETYRRLRNAYGEVVANEYAARVGIDPNDTLAATSAGGTVDTDPLGLGI